jgi:hypothetical protein
MASQIGKCGNMGYVQYNYDAGTGLQWYELSLEDLRKHDHLIK